MGQWSAQERENRAGKWYVHLNFWPCGTRKASRPERKRDGLYDSEAEALVNVGAWRDHHEQKGNTGGRRTRSEGGAAVNATSTAAGAVSIGLRKHGRKAQREAIVRVSDARWGTMMLTSIRAAKTKLSGAGKRLVQSWGRNQTATRDLHYNHTRDAEYAETRAGVLDDARLWRNSSISLLRACVNNDTAISLIVGYDDDLPEDAYSTHIPASLELKLGRLEKGSTKKMRFVSSCAFDTKLSRALSKWVPLISIARALSFSFSHHARARALSSVRRTQCLRVNKQALVVFNYLRIVDEHHFSVGAVGRGWDVDECAAETARQSAFDVAPSTVLTWARDFASNDCKFSSDDRGTHHRPSAAVYITENADHLLRLKRWIRGNLANLSVSSVATFINEELFEDLE